MLSHEFYCLSNQNVNLIYNDDIIVVSYCLELYSLEVSDRAEVVSRLSAVPARGGKVLSRGGLLNRSRPRASRRLSLVLLRLFSSSGCLLFALQR